MKNVSYRIMFLLALLSWQKQLTGQELLSITIDQCYQWAHSNYPMIRQLDLIDQSSEYNVNNVSKGYLPQVNINAQATYQSQVTSIPIDLPNLDIPGIAKDQYKVYADIYQGLNNQRTIKTNQQQIRASAEIEKQEVHVELYKLNERVNQIYFGILLIDQQLAHLHLLNDDLNAGIQKIEAGIANGVSIESNKFLLQAEFLSSAQKILENQSTRAAFIKMLSTFTGKNITDNTTLEIPKHTSPSSQIQRPELGLFELRSMAIDLKFEQINNKKIPSIGLFLQTGFGRPALNFLANDFEAYYLGGLKVNWNLSNQYTSKNDRQILNLTKQSIVTQRESFLLNTALAVGQQSIELKKYSDLIELDRQLIELRKSIRSTAEVQLSNGLIGSLDYIAFINAENRARQNMALHEIQWLLAEYNLKISSGN